MNRRYVIGIDEAGRGPLAGPVSVAAVAIPQALHKRITKEFRAVRDSKKMTAAAREAWFKKIRSHQSGKVLVAVSLVSAQIIDKKGIVSAIRLALGRSLNKLGIDPGQCSVFLDGSLYAPLIYQRQKTIIRGDDTVKIISMASVIAKVHRDKHVIKLAKKYPRYALEAHKGYGTRTHLKLIRKNGLSPIHRKSFLKGLIK